MSIPSRHTRYRPVFKPVRNVDILVSVHILVWYTLAGTVLYQPR